MTYHPAHSGGPNNGVALVREEKGVPCIPHPSDESSSEPRKRKVSPTLSDTNHTETSSPRVPRGRSSSPGAIHPCNINKSIMRTVSIETNPSMGHIALPSDPITHDERLPLTEHLHDMHSTLNSSATENNITTIPTVVGKYFLHPDTDLLCRVHSTLRINSKLLVNYRYPSNAKAGKLASYP